MDMTRRIQVMIVRIDMFLCSFANHWPLIFGILLAIAVVATIYFCSKK